MRRNSHSISASDEVPPLEERRKPGLSEILRGEKSPDCCQSCGRNHTKENPLSRWQECDEWDKKTKVVVVLCESCSGLYIERSPRLYHRLDSRSPFPGAMGICIDCKFREGVSCLSPLFAGERPHIKVKTIADPPELLTYLAISYAETPVYAHVCRSPRSASGFMTLYRGPALECSGKEKRGE
jgi:hypothetical protein